MIVDFGMRILDLPEEGPRALLSASRRIGGEEFRAWKPAREERKRGVGRGSTMRNSVWKGKQSERRNHQLWARHLRVRRGGWRGREIAAEERCAGGYRGGRTGKKWK